MINNIKKRIIALMLTISCMMSFTGCKDDSERKQVTEEENPKIETEVSEKEVQKEEIHYGYTDEQIAEFIEISQQDYHCPNETFDIDLLFEHIISNSNISSENNMFFISDTATDEEKEEIAIFRRSLKHAIQICFENASNDIYEDYCKMSKIRIIRVDYGYPGSFHYEKNLITVNIKWIKLDMEFSKKPIDFEKYITFVLTHELDHVRQFACEHSKRTAFSAKDYGFVTCIESSAESQRYNIGSIASNDSYLRYPTLREGENLLFLIPISFKNKSIEDYYNSMFDSDLEGLYHFFELNTKEDYRTFYDILYDLNTLNGRTKYSKNFSRQEIVTTIGSKFKIGIFKLSVANLMNNIKEQDVTIEDAITIYNIIKSQLIFSNPFYEETTQKYEEDLVTGIEDCEQEFKSFILNFYQITLDDYEAILESIVYQRFLNILNDQILEKYPLIKNILLANPIEQDKLIGVTIGNDLTSYVKIKY